MVLQDCHILNFEVSRASIFGQFNPVLLSVLLICLAIRPEWLLPDDSDSLTSDLLLRTAEIYFYFSM